MTATMTKTPLTGTEWDQLVAGQEIELACMSYLSKLPFTLWGDFDIYQEDRRRQAAAWLTAQVGGVMSELYANRDTDEQEWRDSWQRSLILQKSSAAFRSSRRLLTRLRRRLSHAATHTSGRWTAVRMYLRSRTRPDFSSAFWTWTSSLVGTDQES